ncbi:MAG: hypothetical protein ABIR32_05500, partial [Ilumatobacteraceae bacterium]
NRDSSKISFMATDLPRSVVVDVVVEEFVDLGLDGHLRARLYVDQRPAKLVVFTLNDLDRIRSAAETESEIEDIWRSCIAEMLGCLRLEMQFTSMKNLPNPVALASHLPSAQPIADVDPPPFRVPGTVLARFDVDQRSD